MLRVVARPLKGAIDAKKSPAYSPDPSVSGKVARRISSRKAESISESENREFTLLLLIL